MNFCTKCGNRLAADLKFCTQCGAPIPEPTTPEGAEADREAQVSDPARQTQAVISPPPLPGAEGQSLPVVPVQQSTPATNSGCLSTVVVALSVLAVVAALGIGG